MTLSIPADLAARYERDGYYAPLRAMSAEDAAGFRARLESAEAAHGEGPGGIGRSFAGYGFLTLPLLDELMRLPAILDAVEPLLGPDLMVWGTSLFIKEPNTEHFVSWHQDLHYWGLEADDEVTAWVALSPASVDSGCMRFVPGSHRVRHVPHRDTFSESNLLTRGQELAVEVDEADAVDAALAPGEMSLHHGRLFHASRPNGTDDRRIGIAIRYIRPDMRQVGGVKTFASLVRGRDTHGHFEQAPRPAGELLAEDIERVKEAKARNRSILFEGAEQAPA